MANEGKKTIFYLILGAALIGGGYWAYKHFSTSSDKDENKDDKNPPEKTQEQQQQENQGNVPSEYQKALDYLVKNGASLAVISKWDQNFVIALAKARQAGAPSFEFNGKKYDTKSGKAFSSVSIKSPKDLLDRVIYPKTTANVRSSGQITSSNLIGTILSPDPIGKVITYDKDEIGHVWFKVELQGKPMNRNSSGNWVPVSSLPSTVWVRWDVITAVKPK